MGNVRHGPDIMVEEPVRASQGMLSYQTGIYDWNLLIQPKSCSFILELLLSNICFARLVISIDF